MSSATSTGNVSKPFLALRRTSVALVVLATFAGLGLTACGSGSPAATAPTTAQPTKTRPTTQGPHATPPSVLPILNRALREQDQGQYARAVVDFLAVVKADPTSQIAWYDLGVIAGRHRETAGARRDYQAALHGDADYVPALFNLAQLDAPGDPRTAATLYQHVVRLQPKNANARLNLGFVLRSLGRGAAAKSQFAQAIRLDPRLASRVPATDRGAA